MHLRKVEKKGDDKPSAAYENDVASILKRRYTHITFTIKISVLILLPIIGAKFQIYFFP